MGDGDGGEYEVDVLEIGDEDLEDIEGCYVGESVWGESLEGVLRKELFTRNTSAAMPPPGQLIFDYQRGVPVVMSLLTRAVTDLGGEEVEGIFRLAALKDDVDWIREEIKGCDYRAIMPASEVADYDGPRVRDPLVAADLLKSWLRNLKSPLIPSSLYDQCVNAGRSGDVSLALSVLPLLSPASRACVEHICAFLKSLGAQSSVTKMNTGNLALVFAPNIIKSPSDDPRVFAMHAESEKRFVSMLIDAQN